MQTNRIKNREINQLFNDLVKIISINSILTDRQTHTHTHKHIKRTKPLSISSSFFSIEINSRVFEHGTKAKRNVRYLLRINCGSLGLRIMRRDNIGAIIYFLLFFFSCFEKIPNYKRNHMRTKKSENNHNCGYLAR